MSSFILAMSPDGVQFVTNGRILFTDLFHRFHTLRTSKQHDVYSTWHRTNGSFDASIDKSFHESHTNPCIDNCLKYIDIYPVHVFIV